MNYHDYKNTTNYFLLTVFSRCVCHRYSHFDVSRETSSVRERMRDRVEEGDGVPGSLRPSDRHTTAIEWDRDSNCV